MKLEFLIITLTVNMECIMYKHTHVQKSTLTKLQNMSYFLNQSRSTPSMSRFSMYFLTFHNHVRGEKKLLEVDSAAGLFWKVTGLALSPTSYLKNCRLQLKGHIFLILIMCCYCFLITLCSCIEAGYIYKKPSTNRSDLPPGKKHNKSQKR